MSCYNPEVIYLCHHKGPEVVGGLREVFINVLSYSSEVCILLYEIHGSSISYFQKQSFFFLMEKKPFLKSLIRVTSGAEQLIRLPIQLSESAFIALEAAICDAGTVLIALCKENT